MKKVNETPISRIQKLLARKDEVRILVTDDEISIRLITYWRDWEEEHWFPSLEDLEMYLMTDTKRSQML